MAALEPMEPLPVAAGDPVQRRVTGDSSGCPGEHDQGEVQYPLGCQRGRGIQRRLTGKHCAQCVADHQQKDSQVCPVSTGLVDHREAVTAADDLQRDDDDHEDGHCDGGQDYRVPKPVTALWLLVLRMHAGSPSFQDRNGFCGSPARASRCRASTVTRPL
jgi:hypothetical protein